MTIPAELRSEVKAMISAKTFLNFTFLFSLAVLLGSSLLKLLSVSLSLLPLVHRKLWSFEDTSELRQPAQLCKFCLFHTLRKIFHTQLNVLNPMQIECCCNARWNFQNKSLSSHHHPYISCKTVFPKLELGQSGTIAWQSALYFLLGLLVDKAPIQNSGGGRIIRNYKILPTAIV